MAQADGREVKGNLAATYGVNKDQAMSTFIGPRWGKDVSRHHHGHRGYI